MDRFGAAKHVGNDIGAVQTRQHILAVADLAVHEGHVIDRIERREKRVAGQGTDFGFDRKLAGALDQLVARLTIGDQLGNRDALQFVTLGEYGEIRPAHHRAVVVHQFGKYPDRRYAGKTAEIHASFGMTGAHQHAACFRHQRKHMTGPHEIGCTAIAVGERSHGVVPLLGGNSRGQTMPDVHRHRKRGTERRVIKRHHRVEMQSSCFLDR